MKDCIITGVLIFSQAFSAPAFLIGQTNIIACLSTYAVLHHRDFFFLSWRACQLIFSDRISFNYILILSIQRAIGRTTLAGDNVPNCNDIKKNTFKCWENSYYSARMVNTNGLDLKLGTFECPMFESPISDHYSCTSVSLLLKSTRPI